MKKTSAFFALVACLLVASSAGAQDDEPKPAPPAAPTSEPPLATPDPKPEPADAAPAATPAAASVAANVSTASPAVPRSVTDGAPRGMAAPPSEAATRSGAIDVAGGGVRAGLEVFAQYSYRSFHGPGGNRDWFHAFDVPRVHGALEGQWDNARGRVLLEAVRSAAEGSLVGVAGDSLVVRVREAYAAYRFIPSLEASAGVIPTLTVPNLDGTWMLRAIAPSALEANGLVSPADIGAKVRFDEPHGYGWIATAAYNGDGYTSRELNRGKNIETALELHPLPNGPLKPLGIFGSYINGSTGTSFARANRATGGLVWQGERVRAGAFGTYARGVAQLGTQSALVLSVFARIEPVPRVLVGLRGDHVIRDVGGEPSNALTTLMGAVGYRLALPIEAFLAITRSIPTERAQSELPGTDAWELRTIGRVIF